MMVAAFVFAQSAGATSVSITGSIADEQGAIIVGANISARNLETNITRETRSDKDGSFIIVQLPPGRYELKVEMEGFVTKTANLDLVLGTTTLINFSMRVGGSADIVEVTASSGVDEAKTESSSNTDRERIDNLPINERNFLAFSLTSPRVTVDRVPLQGITITSGLSFNGQSPRFNNVTIDGVDNNDNPTGAVRATFSQDAVQEFQVISDSYSAEYGRSIGGVVNIVTKGGGNDLHGNLFFFNRNDSISARNPFAAINPEFKQDQFGATLGGPIERNRLFYFTSFERLSLKQNNIVTISDATVAAATRQGYNLQNGPLPFSNGTTSVSGRLDGQVAVNDSIWARYNFANIYSGALEPFGGLTAQTSSSMQRATENTIAFNNTYISAAHNLVNDTRILISRRSQDLLVPDDGPQVNLSAPEGLAQFGRSLFLPQSDRRINTNQFIDNVTLTRGVNQIKFGVDYERLSLSSPLSYIGGGLAIFQPFDFSSILGMPGLPFFTAIQAFDPSLRTAEQRQFLQGFASQLPIPFQKLPLADLPLPAAYLQGFGDFRTDINGSFFAVFLQNDLKIRPNLLVKAGLRYDLNRLEGMPDNNGNVSPRLGFSYHPGWLPKLNVRATYGFFFAAPISGLPFVTQSITKSDFLTLPFPLSIVPYSQPGHHFPDANQPPSQLLPVLPQLTITAQFDPHARNTYSQQASFGFDYYFNNNTGISIGYDFVRGLKIVSLRNINPIVRPIPNNAVASAITGRSDPSRGEVFDYESAFDSYYSGLTISFNRRFTHNFGLLAHYTFSKSIDDSIDSIRFELSGENNSLRPGDERGLSLQDVRNRFSLSGIWDLNYTKNRLLRGFQLSTIVDLESGRPYNLVANVDLNMDGDFPPADRPLGLGRNVGITPGFANVDLRLTRTISIKERYRLQGFLEVFNLFNRVNISEVDGAFPPDAQGNFHLPPQEGGRYIATPDRFRNAFAPREFQLGFRLTF